MKILVSLLLLLSFNTYATEDCIMPLEGEATDEFTVDGKGLGDLTLIKLACNNPGHFNNQLPPANIKIYCKHIATNWSMGTPGTMSFPNTQVMFSYVTTNKLGVGMPGVSFNFPTVMAQYPCPNFLQTISCSRQAFNVTCDDIANMDNAVEYCQANMAALTEADSELTVTKPTGATQSLCGLPLPPLPLPGTNGRTGRRGRHGQD